MSEDFERLRVSAGFVARGYRFELVELRETEAGAILTWRAEKPHPAAADLMLDAESLRAADGPSLADEVRERVLYDMKDPVLMADIRSEGRTIE